ncbi:GlcG/HbpS family heme-binding protein [Sulfurimonas sp. CS5]|uniref:GlcG/HbpS family heme-binding protein n=1 Tax=Sulfurimonas sp. CS5 TaxID=3391145 RepID=UPI0039ED71AC
MKVQKIILILIVSASALFSGDVVKIERMSMELAMQVAKKSVESCRKKGYWVSAVVVDRSANVQVALRDTHAARFTMDIAEQKANLVIMSGINSSDFVLARSDIRNELNNINGLIMMDGGVAVKSGDVILGAVGVSGAPGGDIDAACAHEALKLLEERLAFATMSEDD